tara:strand:- start:84 stop:887 length:804 start_codon:yes stop_codon:yes gene_type:complete
MNQIKDYDIQSIFYELSKKIIIPKYKSLNLEDIKYKNKKDLVTSVDIEVEKQLQKKLNLLLPNSLFIGEELFYNNPSILDAYNENQYCWTVDPIDGTANFVRGSEKFAIMIALSRKDTILQSWIYKPLNEEFSYAKLNEGAYINSKKISISMTINISESIGSISSKYWDKKYIDKIYKIKRLFKDVKSYGCIGFEYIDIIKCNRNFAILSKLSPWDHIPGILLLREAGGFDTHFDNTKYKNNIKKNNLIVSNSNILQNEIINLFKEL